jgi:hypothetical protein
MPGSHNDTLHTERWNPYAEMLAILTNQEREELRQTAVASMCELMRDCEDFEVRAEAYDSA